MTQEYVKKLIELVDEIFEDSRFLLKSDNIEVITLASKISRLKGYIEVLKEEKLKQPTL